VYVHSGNILSTTICNLNCSLCLNYEPYNKHKEHMDLSKLKYDIDMYFKHVDKVAYLHVTGGEPTLYPKQIEFIKYINDNYRDKIIDLAMPTNGVIEISDDLCKTFKECDVLVEVDNYLKTVPQYRSIRDNNIEKLQKYGVKLNVIPDEAVPDFISSYPPRYDYSKLSDEENTKRFDYCGSIWSQIRDGGIHLCTYQSFAETAGLVEKDKESFFDLSSDNINKKEFVEFRLKYNNRGFSKFCTMCNGHSPLNKILVTAAEQTKGILSWDGNFTEKDYIPVDILKILDFSVKITVITPTYNRADFLPKTIESILNQTYTNFEYYILDDGSTDNTKEVVKPYLKDNR
ncbi:glycosyltransferase, partial [Brachyspira hampsonii]|nr:glycosyltransferase [Brachyspira hampsonii]